MQLIGWLRQKNAAITAAGVLVAAIGFAVQPLAAEGQAVVDVTQSAGNQTAEAEDFSWFLSPGQYRSTMQVMKMTGSGTYENIASAMPASEPEESSFCLSPDVVPQTQEDWVRSMRDGGCTVDRIDSANGRIDVARVCSGEGRLAISGAISSTGMDVMISFTSLPSESGRFTMRMRVVSERIGDCS